jgi:lipopolysaccharide export system permease protein
MLFGRSLRRDVASSFIATLLVLLTIVLTMMLIRTLGMAANAKLAPQDVALALGYIAMANMPLMLTVSMFIAVVGTLGRMYRDSEMAIWFSSGISLRQFVRPVMALVWPLLLLVAVLSLVVYPWMNQRSDKLRDQFERRSDLSRVTPGQFQTSADGNRVFFVERDSQDKATGSNVFIYGRKEGGESVTTAHTGRIEVRADNRYLELSDGQRNEIDTVKNESTLVQFDTYETAVGDRLASATDKPPAKTRPTIDLIIDADAVSMGELTFRLGLPLAATNMVLLGIGVAASNLRRASNWNMLFALLTFVVYYNLINLSQAWVANGRTSLGHALLSIHGGALVAALLLLWSKENPARPSLLGFFNRQ